MILSNIKKYPPLAFLITVRYFACTYNLRVVFFPQQTILGAKRKQRNCILKVCLLVRGWWPLTQKSIRLNRVSWPWLCISCERYLCHDLAAGPLTELTSNLWIAEKSWAMKADIHKFIPGVSTVRGSRDIPHVGWEIKSEKSLVVLPPYRRALPADRCFPCLPSYSSPYSAQGEHGLLARGLRRSWHST